MHRSRHGFAALFVGGIVAAAHSAASWIRQRALSQPRHTERGYSNSRAGQRDDCGYRSHQLPGGEWPTEISAVRDWLRHPWRGWCLTQQYFVVLEPKSSPSCPSQAALAKLLSHISMLSLLTLN